MSELYNEFINSLKKYFGKYDPDNHRFEKLSNSEIARELGYSDAQFSRLINNSATDGEYQRANQNLHRIIYIEKLEHELAITKDGKQPWLKNNAIWISIIIIVSALAIFFAFQSNSNQTVGISQNIIKRDATLEWAFETSYIKPYVNLDDLPADCNYPCYKYQGKWKLEETYKLPFFREQNGYHYLAKDVTMYARCMSEVTDMGDKFEGYEYQEHEIWYDKRELPIDSFIYNNGQLKAFYKDLDFSQNENFIKIANVHTFFRNEFTIDSLGIKRNGKVIGRDVEIRTNDELNKVIDKDLVTSIKNNLTRISRIKLKDFSKPVACSPSDLPNDDFHLIKDGDKMSFDCELTTSRFSMDYSKTYILTDQYIKNSCRVSVDQEKM